MRIFLIFVFIYLVEIFNLPAPKAKIFISSMCVAAGLAVIQDIKELARKD